jgi:hypothetical protein
MSGHSFTRLSDRVVDVSIVQMRRTKQAMQRESALEASHRGHGVSAGRPPSNLGDHLPIPLPQLVSRPGSSSK